VTTHGALDRSGIAERAAGLIREWIMEGRIKPGTPLVEKDLQARLGVSRNTLREAFRLLTRDQLLTHAPYRGVTVRLPRHEEVADLYRLRRIVECGALRQGDPRSAAAARAELAVVDGEKAVRAEHWAGVAEANLAFHQSIADLADSPRVSELVRGLLSELRLIFHVMDDPHLFHLPYLGENRTIVDRLLAGDPERAAEELSTYFHQAELQLVGRFQDLERDRDAAANG
jgi:DNA-binding GntR family transcriptional regulator